MFISILILHHYDLTLPIRIEVDTSSIIYVGILSLLWEDGWYSITYYSKKFSSAEIYYPIYDKELYVIVYSFR